MVSVLLGLFSLGLFSLRLTNFPLKNWDEAWYAEIIKNLTSGKYGYLVPFWNGRYFFDKPPLYFWLSYPVVKIFGLGEWQVRLISVVAAALSVVLIYQLGRWLFSQRVGVFAALIYISLGQVILRGQEGDLDSLMVCLFLASSYFFVTSRKKIIQIALSGLSLGAGLLVKSWLLGLFPFLFMLCYSIWVDKKLRRNLIYVTVFAFLSVSWWYILGIREFGQEFIGWYLFQPSAGNLGSSIRLDPVFIKAILLDIGLWFVPFIYILLRQRSLSLSKQDSRKLLAFLIPSLVFFIVLNLSLEKFNWYLLPVYPYIALTLALIFSVFVSSGDALVRPLLILAFIGQLFLVYNFHRLDPDRSNVGAILGLAVKNKIPTGSTIILDDPDFSTFLFYSNLKQISVSLQSGGKNREYWILKYEEVKKLPSPIFVITPILQHFSESGKLKSQMELPDNYHLLEMLY